MSFANCSICGADDALTRGENDVYEWLFGDVCYNDQEPLSEYFAAQEDNGPRGKAMEKPVATHCVGHSDRVIISVHPANKPEYVGIEINREVIEEEAKKQAIKVERRKRKADDKGKHEPRNRKPARVNECVPTIQEKNNLRRSARLATQHRPNYYEGSSESDGDEHQHGLPGEDEDWQTNECSNDDSFELDENARAGPPDEEQDMMHGRRNSSELDESHRAVLSNERQSIVHDRSNRSSGHVGQVQPRVSIEGHAELYVDSIRRRLWNKNVPLHSGRNGRSEMKAVYDFADFVNGTPFLLDLADKHVFPRAVLAAHLLVQELAIKQIEFDNATFRNPPTVGFYDGLKTAIATNHPLASVTEFRKLFAITELFSSTDMSFCRTFFPILKATLSKRVAQLDPDALDVIWYELRWPYPKPESIKAELDLRSKGLSGAGIARNPE